MKYEDFQYILFERHDDGVMLATLNRPEVMNATNARLHWELTKIWDVLKEDAATKVVVITGASSGQGEATARHLAERGAAVVLGA